ncbi:MAG: hypothetical protein U9N09_04795 [Euryarchaeota archaeon]|nr:hypothetical protein [Euryarchaeota archaeon]
MNRTRTKIGLTSVLKLPMPVSQVLADEDGAKDIIRLIEDGIWFSQVTSASVYATGQDGYRKPPLDVN